MVLRVRKSKYPDIPEGKFHEIWVRKKTKKTKLSVRETLDQASYTTPYVT